MKKYLNKDIKKIKYVEAYTSIDEAILAFYTINCAMSAYLVAIYKTGRRDYGRNHKCDSRITRKPKETDQS